MFWGRFTSLWTMNPLQIYYWVYIIVLNLFFYLGFTSFVCVCLHFFFLPFLKQLQNQSLCQHWTARGKGKGLAISNAFKFIRVLDVFSRLSLLTATPVPLWILMTCNRGHQSWSIQARDITMPKVIVPLA